MFKLLTLCLLVAWKPSRKTNIFRELFQWRKFLLTSTTRGRPIGTHLEFIIQETNQNSLEWNSNYLADNSQGSKRLVRTYKCFIVFSLILDISLISVLIPFKMWPPIRLVFIIKLTRSTCKTILPFLDCNQWCYGSLVHATVNTSVIYRFWWPQFCVA